MYQVFLKVELEGSKLLALRNMVSMLSNPSSTISKGETVKGS